MKNYKRSDLACEAADDLSHIEGTEYENRETGGYRVETLKIITEIAAARLGKSQGQYTTVTSPEIWKLDEYEISDLADVIAGELRRLILKVTGAKEVTPELSVLVVGLGNAMITADAIGPKAADGIDVTRHIKMLDPSLFGQLHACEISALSPGVLGKTGIESAEIVKSACIKVEPDAVIVIDALAAGAVERLATTVQLSDTGINPGAGIGNFRSELSENTLGAPVIALGVPTVVDSSAVVYDAFCRAGISENIPDALIRHLDSSERYYVTPKESDVMTENISRLLSLAISRALVIS